MNDLQTKELQEIESIDFIGNEQEKERFKITDQAKLNWAFRKLAVLDEKEKSVEEIAAQEMERIKEWKESELAPVRDKRESLESLVQEYHSLALKYDPTAKTLKTPHGRCKSITRKPTPIAADKYKLLEHVKTAGATEFVKVKEEVKWSDYKKLLNVVTVGGKETVIDENGQEVAGVTIQPETTTYKIDLG
ncbi:host-nuclease inhibitor Gam family protein [Shouchella lonarensis]|uniref:Bacteriophage Mu Gam like protein n=1 Tax=Shouchella lonarensis TaxID=1464122 RepID=A0A1G6IL28_9BACI|nr:host-nuclease inhibitor Gam family protein [Shouchella lonarensis]SDC07153.1 Bacteriophage Mu Gam like protein [Shouchella lonarensis]